MKPIKKAILITCVPFIILATYYFYPEPKLPQNSIIDSIDVSKSKHQLFAYSKGKLMKTYHIAIGKNAIGRKEFEGDKKTPEGVYHIHNKNPNSGYHKNLGVSYPNNDDRKRAKQLNKPTGGEIKIHGLKNGHCYIYKFHRWKDWTDGCIALTDAEVDELYDAVAIGCRIEIKP